ncbi:hypothetical protein BH09PSE3_BH09PSE3_23730 [soil metagenome]
MELKHIDIACLSVSPANMRGVKKAPDLTNILPSVRARGILVPLIVRQNGSPTTYEIVAGKRRYHAAMVVAQEAGSVEPLPCAVIEAGDDAAALEASLIENIARLDPDEMTQCETFTRLVREGRSVEDISLTFGLTTLQVKRTLALGNLLPRIRSLYRAEKIDAVTVRHLTLASKVQQREWLALLDDDAHHAPYGQNLKSWLFGGTSISTKVALFDNASYSGEIISDLFGEDSYFASAADFWTAQMVAVEDRVQAYRDAGWRDVAILERGAYFHSWEHEPVIMTRTKDGRALSRRRYHIAEGFLPDRQQATGLGWHDYLYKAGITAQLALSSHLLDVGFPDGWNARHIGLRVAKSLAYANATGFGHDCPDMARLAAVLSPYWQWNRVRLFGEPEPDDGGFTVAQIEPLLRALLDRVRGVTGHPRPKDWRRSRQEGRS